MKKFLSFIMILLIANIVSAAPAIMPYECDGTATNEFDEGDDLCVYGTGFDADIEVDILVVEDQDDYTEGEALSAVAKETVTTTPSGLIAMKNVWQSVIGGLYDIIVDIARNGIWNSGDATNIGSGAGVTVEGSEELGDGPDEPGQPVGEVPEFTTIGAMLVLIAAGFIISRKRKNK